eukprot:TRINITY_DN3017_c0_g2_i1.p1 TRINITY_DN3017_c0_g2~~TRINITY_DN3017_c0_g2_i1.p1  ORF type:complete len:411 (-),score=83.61 TRINITY_DN3017_c0_g2_i1:61-1293(-)
MSVGMQVFLRLDIPSCGISKTAQFSMLKNGRHEEVLRKCKQWVEDVKKWDPTKTVVHDRLSERDWQEIIAQAGQLAQVAQGLAGLVKPSGSPEPSEAPKLRRRNSLSNLNLQNRLADAVQVLTEQRRSSLAGVGAAAAAAADAAAADEQQPKLGRRHSAGGAAFFLNAPPGMKLEASDTPRPGTSGAPPLRPVRGLALHDTSRQPSKDSPSKDSPSMLTPTSPSRDPISPNGTRRGSRLGPREQALMRSLEANIASLKAAGESGLPMFTSKASDEKNVRALKLEPVQGATSGGARGASPPGCSRQPSASPEPGPRGGPSTARGDRGVSASCHQIGDFGGELSDKSSNGASGDDQPAERSKTIHELPPASRHGVQRFEPLRKLKQAQNGGGINLNDVATAGQAWRERGVSH